MQEDHKATTGWMHFGDPQIQGSRGSSLHVDKQNPTPSQGKTDGSPSLTPSSRWVAGHGVVAVGTMDALVAPTLPPRDGETREGMEKKASRQKYKAA